MASGIDMSDQNAWDDSFLINSWDEAVAEYKKYHSIHKSGKKLEDVLTDEELRELRGEDGDLIGEAETAPVDANTNGNGEGVDTEMSHLDSLRGDLTNPPTPQQQESKTSEQQLGSVPGANALTSHDALLAGPMPQAILGTVQDENLKNIMMSWYYAGYYTGLHAGQQQASKDAPLKQ